MTKKCGLILVSALAIALAASVASAATSNWTMTSGTQCNWVLASASDRYWSTYSPALLAHQPWDTIPLWDGTDDLVFSNGANVAANTNATQCNSITFNAGSAESQINQEYTTLVLTVNSGNITSNGNDDRIGENGGQVVIPGTATGATFTVAHSLRMDHVIADVAAVKNGTGTLTIGQTGTDSTFYSTFNDNGGQLNIGTVNFIGAVTFNSAGMHIYETPNTGTAGASTFGDVVVAQSVSFYLQGTPQNDNVTINGNLSGTGTFTRSRPDDNAARTMFLNGTNNTFSGNMNLQSGFTEFDGTFTGMGNIAVSTGGYGQVASMTGHGNVGMAAGESVTVTGTTYNSNPVIITIAPKGGTLTLGTEGNSNTVNFQTNAQLTLNLNDTLTDGVTPVADSLAINGALNLGTGATTNVLNLTFATGLSKFTTYTLATYDSISSIQQMFNSVLVNGTLLSGNGTAKDEIDAGHSLIYGSTSLILKADSLIPGDINGDGLVDVADYNVWAADVGMTGATWSQGDLNGDGLVDVADYNIWAANVGNTAATPEPISMIILAIGSGLVALKRRNG